VSSAWSMTSSVASAATTTHSSWSYIPSVVTDSREIPTPYFTRWRPAINAVEEHRPVGTTPTRLDHDPDDAWNVPERAPVAAVEPVDHSPNDWGDAWHVNAETGVVEERTTAEESTPAESGQAVEGSARLRKEESAPPVEESSRPVDDSAQPVEQSAGPVFNYADVLNRGRPGYVARLLN
jgi:hypothetical protein